MGNEAMLGRLRALMDTGRRVLPHIVKRGCVLGHCVICERTTLFYREGTWLRDQFMCIRCKSIPRWRALIYVMDEFVPRWRELVIHESSPGGPASAKLASEAVHYTPTFFFPDVAPGQYKNGYRCENLEQQTFDSETFDLIISQDVFEHVLDPAAAFKEVARTLKPGGIHVFTVPWYYWKPTLVRAVRENGAIRHLVEPEYHGNPIDSNGSLVVTEWGSDFCDFVYRKSGMTTTPVRILDRYRGIEAKFIEVFISRKHEGECQEL